MKIEDAIKALADDLIRDAGDSIMGDMKELRDRLELALSDYTAITLAAAAGQDVKVHVAAIKARLASLQAAGLMIAAGEINRTIHNALMGGIRIVFSSLL